VNMAGGQPVSMENVKALRAPTPSSSGCDPRGRRRPYVYA
jgi:hypothetical protein